VLIGRDCSSRGVGEDRLHRLIFDQKGSWRARWGALGWVLKFAALYLLVVEEY
jgi:hypothetical protein